jgi:hypothetical protein
MLLDEVVPIRIRQIELNHCAGKKDTPVAAVRAVSYVEDQIPPDLDRVASILAGRVTLPVVDVNQVMSRSFSTSARCPVSGRTGSWRGFAALAAVRRYQ